MTEQTATQAPPTLLASAEVLARVDDGYAELQAALAGLTEAQKLQPGATGHWRVKDVLAHLTRWDDVALVEMRAYLANQTTGVDYRDIQAWNERWASEDWDLPLGQVETAFEASHRQIRDFLGSLSEEQWIRPVRGWARGAVWGHYPERAEWLRAWRGTLSSRPAAS